MNLRVLLTFFHSKLLMQASEPEKYEEENLACDVYGIAANDEC